MFLLPQLVETRQSKVNGQIEVYSFFNHYTLRVNHLTQSGGLVKDIWQKALTQVKNQNSKVNHCLILGLGGGTAAQLVAQLWPPVQITGIELDPVMIQLGQKYFHLSQVKNLHIIKADATTWVSSVHQKFDLILVDIYTGQTIPPQIYTSTFLKALQRLTTSHGLVIFNFLKKTIIPNLNSHFSQVTRVSTPANHLLLVK